MLWSKSLLKNEEGYGTVELLILMAGVAILASRISEVLLGTLKPIHKGAVKNIKGVSQSGL